jgi:subtilisin family serine protease
MRIATGVIVLALSGMLGSASAQEAITGQISVVWGEGPDAEHSVVLVDASGNRTPISLPGDVTANGLGALDRKHVSVVLDPLSGTFDADGALHVREVQFIESQKVDAALTAQVQEQGSARVLVWLNTSFQPEGTLLDAAVADQRTSIASTTNSLIDALAGSTFEVARTFETVPLVALVVGPDALAALAGSPQVERVEIDSLSAPTLAQSTVIVGADSAWAQGYNGEQITVAILDTGVMKTHAAFGGRVISEACYSSNGTGFQSLCPGGVTASTAVGSGVNCTGVSGCDHGTHVAGIAAGAPFTGFTAAGVGRGALITAMQIFTRFNNASDCSPNAAPCLLSFTSDQIKGLERVYALRNSRRFASVNMSLGGGLTSVHCDGDSRKPIIDNLRSVGISTVIAAGNGGSRTQISAPACISTSVSVGSTNDNSGGWGPVDAVSSFSNAANIMDMWAPGALITAPVITSTTATGGKTGTSMAAPHVAGAFAVVRHKRPYGTTSQLESAIINQGVNVTDTRSGGVVTKRRLRVLNALNSISPSATVTELWPSSLGAGSSTIRLWARVAVTQAMPATAAVWFWVEGVGWVGSVSLSGQAAGTSVWRSFDWTVPFTAVGNLNYFARVWDGGQGGFWGSAWSGSELISVGSPTTITSLWPVYDQTGSPVINRGVDQARLWTRVRNDRQQALPNAGVWNLIQPSSGATFWAGSVALTGQAPLTNEWRLLNWSVPASQPTGTTRYYGQVWWFNGFWRQWTPLFGPQVFTISP